MTFRVVATYKNEIEEEGDLAFEKGDVIIVTSSDGDWWDGKLEDGSREGSFPKDYVKRLDEGSDDSGDETDGGDSETMSLESEEETSVESESEKELVDKESSESGSDPESKPRPISEDESDAEVSDSDVASKGGGKAAVEETRKVPFVVEALYENLVRWGRYPCHKSDYYIRVHPPFGAAPVGFCRCLEPINFLKT